MIDVSELITDDDFAQSFNVYRISGVFGIGGWIADPEQTIPMSGVVTVTSVRDLEQIPEGDRVRGMMTFHTTEELFVTRQGAISDEIEWRGDRYRVYQVSPYVDYGYFKAIGSRMSGE